MSQGGSIGLRKEKVVQMVICVKLINGYPLQYKYNLVL